MNNDLFLRLVREHQLQCEKLTEDQLAETIRQVIESGDMMKHVTVDGAQAVTYAPYREVEHWKSLYHELIWAVVQIHDGESRHQTALRYIKERENMRYGGETKESANP